MALFQINNFSGIITRKRYGTMNSGMTRLGKSHSVDPFTAPPSLSFNEVPTNLDPTHATITDLLVDGATNEEAGTLYLYAIDRSGHVYKINTTTDAITLITNSLGITLKVGGGIKIIEANGTSYLFITHDGILGGASGAEPVCALYMKLDGTGVVQVFNITNFAVADTAVSVANNDIQLDNSIVSMMITGQGVQLTGGSSPPPSPLAYPNVYYIIVQDPTHIQLATTAANALAGVPIILTDTGFSGGTFNFRYFNWTMNIPHPLSDEFFGGLFIGNGPFLVDFAIGSLIVSHASRLNPTFPYNYTINAVEVDGEGRYLRVNATTGTTQDVIITNPGAPSQAPLSRAVYWNGVDDSYDSYDPFTQTNTSSMISFLGVDITFGQDFFGSGMFQTAGGTVDKILAMKDVRPPTIGALTATANLLLFGAPYFVQNAWRAGVFAFGKLDDQDENNSVYPLVGIAPTSNNTVCTAVGLLRLVQNRYVKSDGTLATNSKLYASTYETGGAAAANLYSFSITPNGGTPNDGIYETEVEKFTMEQAIDRIAIYLLPTQSGVSFKLELVDANGTVPSGGSFTYTYAAGDEINLGGTLEFFEWADIQVKNFQSMGVRLTNLGTVQPSIQQIYIETHDTDKGATPQTPN